MKSLFLVLFFISCSSKKSWLDASRESANISPKPTEVQEDIYQIFYARAFSWRGYFGVHPWVSWKKKNDKEYTVAQIISWNLRSTGTALSIQEDIPDRLWYDSKPTLLFEVRGEKATKIIEETQILIEKYPHKNSYTLFPGPNSNTFVSYIIRNIDDIKIELPPHAIGKDYLVTSSFLAESPSNTGFQVSAWGLFSLTLGLGEGIEVNLLGLNFGLDFYTPALKLPFIGRLGMDDKALE